MLRFPLGKQVHAALIVGGGEAALALAQKAGQPDLFERVKAVATESPVPAFLHSFIPPFAPCRYQCVDPSMS